MSVEVTQALKPCPFCGSGPARMAGRFTNASFSGVELATDRHGVHRVICGTCGSEGAPEATEDEAITAWNTRPQPTTAEIAQPSQVDITEAESQALHSALLASTDELVRPPYTLPQPSQEVVERVAELHWPKGKYFTFHDDGGHNPCYVVMPDGAAIPINHWDDEVTDIARAKWIIVACNTALSALPTTAALMADNARLREALEWYESQVSKVRMNHKEGDGARHKLDRDCGQRARTALKGTGHAG